MPAAEQDLAAWQRCHGVSREMVLPGIIRADGPGALLHTGWMGRARVQAGSGHCPAVLAVFPSPLLVPQMVPSMFWGEWEQIPLRRRWFASMSRRRTTGSRCPPCPHHAMGPLPSCRATRSSSWVGRRAQKPAPMGALLQGPGLLHEDPSAGHHWWYRLPLRCHQPLHLIHTQEAGRASCPSPPLRLLTWRQRAGRATPVCPAAAPSPPAPWLTASSSA